MKLAIFTPYGLLHREGGVLYLVANYLAKSGAEVLQFRCDGAVPACGRDRSGGVERTPFQCARCANDQQALASWAGIPMRDLSSWIRPEDVKKVREWIHGVPSHDLQRLEFRGVNLWSVISSELQMRWEGLDSKILTGSQEASARDLFISYVRVALAAERFMQQWKPDLTLMSAINEPMAHAYLLQAKLAKVDSAVCSYNAEGEQVVVESLATHDRYATKLVLEGITSMRADPRTWGPEVTAVVHEVLTYLGCPADRLR